MTAAAAAAVDDEMLCRAAADGIETQLYAAKMVLSLCGPIDLAKLSRHKYFLNTVFNARFAAVQVLMYDEEEDTKVVFLVFASGIVNLVGVKTEARMHYWFAEFRRVFFSTFRHAMWRAPTERVTMCTATGRLPWTFDVAVFLASSAVDTTRVSYWPSRFPALTYRPHKNIAVNVFPGSTKFVVTGALNKHDLQMAAYLFMQLIAATRRPPPPMPAPPPPPMPAPPPPPPPAPTSTPAEQRQTQLQLYRRGAACRQRRAARGDPHMVIIAVSKSTVSKSIDARVYKRAKNHR